MTTSKNNLPAPDLAVLVGVAAERDLDELEALCDTCNIKTAERITQNVKTVDVATYIHSGKVAEVRAAVEKHGATCVVFDVELSGSKVRNLETALGVAVLDRSLVILDIFAQRATSAEGKLQVELAQLKYNMPRLVGSGGLMSKMRNSVGMRGPGEKKLELDKRRIRDDVIALERELAKLRDQRILSRQKATKSGKPRVCLVGYTNSGKSTLLNTIAKADVYARDQLFATLDPKTVNVYADGVQFLLTDTVGFIDKLPHEFINAFESTLDEVRYANLLLHVVDISNPNYEQQMATVNDVLKKIKADHIPTIMVYNKIDKMPSLGGAGGVTPHAISISAHKNQNIDLLKQKIVHIISNESNSIRRDE